MYDYQTEKPKLLTDEGQRVLIRVRDHVKECLSVSGAIDMTHAMKGVGGGDSWTMMAYIDRLVEIGDIREITQGHDVPAQYRVFVSSRR